MPILVLWGGILSWKLTAPFCFLRSSLKRIDSYLYHFFQQILTEPCYKPSCIQYCNYLLKPNFSVERATKQSLVKWNHGPHTLELEGILKLLAVHSHPRIYGKVLPRAVGEFVFTQPTRAKVRSYGLSSLLLVGLLLLPLPPPCPCLHLSSVFMSRLLNVKRLSIFKNSAP